MELKTKKSKKQNKKMKIEIRMKKILFSLKSLITTKRIVTFFHILKSIQRKNRIFNLINLKIIILKSMNKFQKKRIKFLYIKKKFKMNNKLKIKTKFFQIFKIKRLKLLLKIKKLMRMLNKKFYHINNRKISKKFKILILALKICKDKLIKFKTRIENIV